MRLGKVETGIKLLKSQSRKVAKTQFRAKLHEKRAITSIRTGKLLNQKLNQYSLGIFKMLPLLNIAPERRAQIWWRRHKREHAATRRVKLRTSCNGTGIPLFPPFTLKRQGERTVRAKP